MPGAAHALHNQGQRAGHCASRLPEGPEGTSHRRWSGGQGPFPACGGLPILRGEVGEQQLQQAGGLRCWHVHDEHEQHQELHALRRHAERCGLLPVERGDRHRDQDNSAIVAVLSIHQHDGLSVRVHGSPEVAGPGCAGPQRARAPLPVLSPQRRSRRGPAPAELRDICNGRALPNGDQASDGAVGAEFADAGRERRALLHPAH
mmetsp:Transcript_1055/g.2500  ORF Transcript_1055/g.2500 Transcript_1055/m.2500 type:complete len:204 (+) Transcript_1055:634-1245(+)